MMEMSSIRYWQQRSRQAALILTYKCFSLPRCKGYYYHIHRMLKLRLQPGLPG